MIAHSKKNWKEDDTLATLHEVAKYIRSKNAGPFWVTVDIFCEDDNSYNKIKNSTNISPKLIAETYNVQEKNVKLFFMDHLRVVKFSYPRSRTQGHRYENDMHAGQQYVLISDSEV